MVNRELLEEVSRLGVPLMLPDEKTADAHQTLAEVVRSRDTRLWENFPALLDKCFERYQVDLSKVQARLQGAAEKKAFQDLLDLSQALSDAYHVPFAPLSVREGSASASPQPLQDRLAQESFPVSDLNLSVERVRRAFEDHLGRKDREEQEQTAQYQELALEYALAQVFSPRQKELFKKRLNGEKLTKTEREYFSRTVKRKVQALANQDLNRLAQKLLQH